MATSLAADLEAFRAYREHARREVSRVKRNLDSLSDDDKASLVRAPNEQVQKMEEAVQQNAVFLDKVQKLISDFQSQLQQQPAMIPIESSSPSQKSIQVFMQTFVREWSKEGEAERKECFDLLKGALEKHMPAKSAPEGEAPKVLVLGCKLGRLLLEVQQMGYRAEGCEGKPLLYFGCELIRKESPAIGCHRIQPFVLNTCNRFKMDDHVRVVPMPDVEVAGMPSIKFGTFVQLYGNAQYQAGFDAVVTGFSMDTSVSIFRYVRAMAHVVRPGGVWANFGPLAFDAEDDEAHGHGIELSWEELKMVVSHFFDVHPDERFVDSLHAANGESMMQMQYSCIYFAATRNSTPADFLGEAEASAAASAQ